MRATLRPMDIANHSVAVAQKLKEAGLRPTRQRIMLGSLLWSHGHRHLTAESLHSEAKVNRVKVSLATIYNTLHQFTDVGLLREIVVDGGRSYFDTNTEAHHHFLHEDTGMLEDIPADMVRLQDMPQAPAGKRIKSVDVVIRVSEDA